MRPAGVGTLSVGLIAVSVELYPATQGESAGRAHEVHGVEGCRSRIRHRRVCEAGHEVPYEQVARGINTEAGTVILSDEDLAQLPLPTRRTVELVGFIPSSAVDPLWFDRGYYISPRGPGSARPYALLAAALSRSGRVGVGKTALRTRERPVVVRPYGARLALHTVYWPRERRPPPEDRAFGVPVSERELAMAQTLVEALGAEELPEMHDDYAAALDRLVEAKISGGELAAPPEAPAVMDLMAALEESIRAARAQEGDP
ncbi:non-homologous end joining protein Ku [Streptomyces halobius]|uniref:Ku protein n=1 Tax=Streptomyces halobius TaxID=2879846 RepID=A0ABY4M3C7_9ACTN|nr:Ku protein [Streptomyces halobius]UQA91364.1 Ku protein [Streptomyces halobius]